MLATTLLTTLTSLAPLQDAGADWPHLRGSDGSGHTDWDAGAASALQTVWRAPLGPAYCGVAIADGRLVTMFSDGSEDHVVALSADSGSELWRTSIGPTYRGHDGSEDGPIASPTLGGGMAFVLGARGKLRALDAESGEERWSVDLVADLGAEAPEYGFSSTPLLVGDVLVVQAGGSEGRALCGFKAGTGELSWSLGEGPAAYQSPIAMKIGGATHVVALGGESIWGVAPETGALLWQHELGERSSAESGMPLPMGDGRFGAYVNGMLTGFAVKAKEIGFEVSELYRSREIGRTYACPVYYDGHVYGYRSDFLTCVDATTGKRVWKSRPPGGRGLIGLGDKLAVFGADGVVALVAASPEGYVEHARTEALEHSSYSWPSFAAGRVYVRNSKEIACVAVGGEPLDTLAAATGSDGEADDFVRFVQSVEGAQDKQARIDAFLAEHTTFPIVEGNRVHLAFQGEVEDIAVVGSMVANGKPEALERIDGTNFFYKSYEIEPGARWEYRFQVNFDEWMLDPLNPNRGPGRRGEVSEVLTPTYEQATHVLEPSGARGRLEPFEFASDGLESTRELQIYLPAGYDDGEAAYPLLIVHSGTEWLEQGLMPNSLDNLIGTEVAPIVVAFVPPIDDWWFEAGGTGTEEYLDAVVNELLPALAERYRLTTSADERALLGTRHFGMTAVHGALRHSDVFGKAAVQSMFLGDVSRHAIFEMLAGEQRDVEFYIDWNRYEMRDLDRGFDYGADSRRLWEALEERGYTLHGGEALDGHGWGSWRSRTDDVLTALFPLESSR